MKRLAAILCALLCGCASYHRRGESTHNVYRGRSDGLVERWTDLERGGGVAVLSDSRFDSITAIHVNQRGSIIIGNVMSDGTSTNADKVISAGGAALGAIVEDAEQGAKSIP